MPHLNVTIRFKDQTRGGRRTPPEGRKYAAVARFPDLSSGSWSVVLWFRGDVMANDPAGALLTFLSPHAPVGSISANDRFSLFEGPREVAEGIVEVAGKAFHHKDWFSITRMRHLVDNNMSESPSSSPRKYVEECRCI